MLETITVILAVVLMFVLATLGCVLLTAFFLAKRAFGTRVFLASVLGPGLLIVPMSLLALTEGSFEASLGLLILVALASVFLGWPVSHIATRRLDRMIKFDLETFR